MTSEYDVERPLTQRAFITKMETDVVPHAGENIIDLEPFGRPYIGYAASPFRYPGGKGFLTRFLASEIKRRFEDQCPAYAEPYCGGAGAALNLLLAGDVSALHLNDADARIYSAWNAIVHETERFIARIEDVSVDLDTWEKCIRKIYDSPDLGYDFEVGFAAFFVNRTSRSGVIIGSGPIGGYNQEGKWKIDARFNKETLVKKVRLIGEQRAKISLSCMDGLDFCNELAASGRLDHTFLFVDPPYVGAGGRLYYNGMSDAKHERLASWLKSDIAPHWLLTYDDHPLVRENFRDCEEQRIKVIYSLGRRRAEKELLYMSRSYG